jgi:hypothetical protein
MLANAARMGCKGSTRNKDRRKSTANCSIGIRAQRLIRSTWKVRITPAQSPQAMSVNQALHCNKDIPSSYLVPAGMKREWVNTGSVRSCWFRREKDSAASPVLYLHGGGYVGGSVEASRGMAARLAENFGRAGPSHSVNLMFPFTRFTGIGTSEKPTRGLQGYPPPRTLARPTKALPYWRKSRSRSEWASQET